NNFNEIRFEDKIGEEEIHIQAEKDFTTLVKHDMTTTVNHDQTTTVLNDRSATIQGFDSVTVNKDRTVHVKGNLSMIIDAGSSGANHQSTKVTGKYKLDVSDSIDETAPTYIKLACQSTYIEMLPGKITFHAGPGAEVVMDAKIVATANAKGAIAIDGDVKLN